MKVGAVIGAFNPESGGAFSFVETIRRQIAGFDAKNDEFVFVCSAGKDMPREFTLNGSNFVNMDAWVSAWKRSLWRRLAERLRRVIGNFLCTVPRHDVPVLDSIAKRLELDIYWLLSPIALTTTVPYIYTIWDLAHRTAPYFPEVSKAGWDWDAREGTYASMIYRASYIITGNEEGKKEVLSNYPVPEAKIRIVEFPIPDFEGELKPAETERLSKIKGPFLFYPAQFWPHKNHVTILRALKELVDRYGKSLHVVFTGSDKGNKAYIEKMAQSLGLEEQTVFLGFVSKAEMRFLYQHAVCLVFASLLGPNNLPPLEAISLGCPVVISDLDGHKEQLGNAALYFPGTDHNALAAYVAELLDSPELRNSLISHGHSLISNRDRNGYVSAVLRILNEFREVRSCWDTDYFPA